VEEFVLGKSDIEEIKFHHVGIVVETNTIKDLLANFIKLPSRSYYVETQGVDVTFLPLGNAYIEMIYPHGNQTIEKYVEREGEGIHHFCFEVSDIDYWAKKCKEKGFKVVSRDQRCFFIHPKTFGGVLVEFITCRQGELFHPVTVLNKT